MVIAQLGQQNKPSRDQVRREGHSLAVSDTKLLSAFHRGDKPRSVTRANNEIEGLVDVIDHDRHVRKRHRSQARNLRLRVDSNLEHRPSVILALLVLHRKVTVDEHRQ